MKNTQVIRITGRTPRFQGRIGVTNLPANPRVPTEDLVEFSASGTLSIREPHLCAHRALWGDDYES
jgi:hypothetical protein